MGRHWMTMAGGRLLWAAPGEGGATLEAAALLGATGESRVVRRVVARPCTASRELSSTSSTP